VSGCQACEHFAEAEKSLSQGCEYACPHSGCQHELAALARAQVHATLALALATSAAAHGEAAL
jgi:hypothetical protein